MPVHGPQEALLVAETGVDRAHRDVGALADVLDRERLEALLLEQRRRSLEHRSSDSWLRFCFGGRMDASVMIVPSDVEFENRILVLFMVHTAGGQPMLLEAEF